MIRNPVMWVEHLGHPSTCSEDCHMNRTIANQEVSQDIFCFKEDRNKNILLRSFIHMILKKIIRANINAGVNVKS